MKILIVDDLNEKAAEVKNVCKKNEDIKDDDITIVPGVIEAIAKMKEKNIN